MPEFDHTVHEEAVLIDDDLWEVLIALTDGDAALCFQCGVCTATCPWGAVKQEPLKVRTLISQVLSWACRVKMDTCGCALPVPSAKRSAREG